MDGETRAYLDQALGSLRQEFVGLRQEVRDTAAETRRHFDAVAESLRRDIQTMAEGGALRQLTLWSAPPSAISAAGSTSLAQAISRTTLKP